MPVTNYYTVNGSIVGEKTTGGSRIDYLTDMLGSVTATVNQSAQVRNTYRYKPYGGTLAKTGTDPDPTFGWVGTQGYRPTQKKFSDFYVRARHPDSATGRWSTVDPIAYRGGLNLFIYVGGAVTRFTDPTGLICEPNLKNPCDTMSDADLCKTVKGIKPGDGGLTACCTKSDRTVRTAVCVLDAAWQKPLGKGTAVVSVKGTCLSDCRAVHETSHINDPNCQCDFGTNSWGCAGERNRQSSECAAWQAGLRCLIAKVGSTNSDDFVNRGRQCCRNKIAIGACLTLVEIEICTNLRNIARECTSIPPEFRGLWKEFCGGTPPVGA